VDDPRARPDAGSPATISACIIARDEARSIGDCLASVSFCQEILVVDSGSVDDTVAIARGAGARVLEHRWMGYAKQRNLAIDNAGCDWILEIDADERVTAPLREQIEAFLAATPPGVALAAMPHREYFLGHRLGPSAKYPKYRHRMFRRGSYRHDENRLVHEGLIPEGPVEPFDGDLTHLLATSWGEAVADAWRYARLEAGQMAGPRTPVAAVRGVLARPLAKFAYRLVVDGGWRDGWPGLAKIASDCGIDAIVWMRFLLGRRGELLGDSGVAQGLHYGAWKTRRGSLRVVGLASSAQAGPAAAWLAAAARGGADVALIAAGPAGALAAAQDAPRPAPASPSADGPAAAGVAAVRVRRIERLGPLEVCRALDAEEQLRPIDAVVPFGGSARRILSFVPGSLRGQMSDLTGEQDASALRWDAGARGTARAA